MNTKDGMQCIITDIQCSADGTRTMKLNDEVVGLDAETLRMLNEARPTGKWYLVVRRCRDQRIHNVGTGGDELAINDGVLIVKDKGQFVSSLSSNLPHLLPVGWSGNTDRHYITVEHHMQHPILFNQDAEKHPMTAEEERALFKQRKIALIKLVREATHQHSMNIVDSTETLVPVAYRTMGLKAAKELVEKWIEGGL